jgi:hypothetical protein
MSWLIDGTTLGGYPYQTGWQDVYNEPVLSSPYPLGFFLTDGATLGGYPFKHYWQDVLGKPFLSPPLPSSLFGVNPLNEYNGYPLKSEWNIPLLGAFASCENLTSVILPTQLTSIGGESFRGASSLANVTVPSTTTLGTRTFNRATNVTIQS